MILHSKMAAALMALAVFLPLALPAGPAHAQQSAPKISGFDVVALRELSAGNELAFTLYGSPGGAAKVQVGGATAGLMLAEVEPGVYEGTHTISKRDRITAKSTATANLRLGNRVASSVLDESLLAGAPAPWSAGSSAPSGGPKIDRFEVTPPSHLTAGEELPFTLLGTPAGTASARIDGIKGKVALDEIKPGVYQGSYTVKTRDKIAGHTAVTGTLRLGEQERSAVLGQALEQSSAQRSKSSARPVAAKVPACVDCGTVEAVNRVEHQGEGSYLGMIGGGVAGALLGSQVGEGRGTTVAEVVGAAGGAYAGNEVEKRMKTTTHYEVMVRLQNGGSRMISYPAQPAFTVGSRVRVDNGTLVQI